MDFNLMGSMTFSMNIGTRKNTISINADNGYKVDTIHLSRTRLKEYAKIIKRIGIPQEQWESNPDNMMLNAGFGKFYYSDSTGCYHTDEDIIAIHNKEREAKRTKGTWSVKSQSEWETRFVLIGVVYMNNRYSNLTISSDVGYSMTVQELSDAGYFPLGKVIKRVGTTETESEYNLFEFEENGVSYFTNEDAIAIVKKEREEYQRSRQKQKA